MLRALRPINIFYISGQFFGGWSGGGGEKVSLSTAEPLSKIEGKLVNLPAHRPDLDHRLGSRQMACSS